MAAEETASPLPTVAIGASAGGVEALTKVVSELPPGLEAAVLVVLHISPSSPSVLADILGRAGPLPAAPARDGEPLLPGRIYVAPPDRHLMVHDGAVVLNSGPRENGHRPSVDALFRSAAKAQGPAVIGVVLSGARDDGTTGLSQIKALGGTAIVQDPDDASFRGMPCSAIERVAVDHVAPASAIGRLVTELARNQSKEVRGAMSNPEPPEQDQGQSTPEDLSPGLPTRFTCPECGGGLGQVEEAGVVQYHCSVGHKYGIESLVDEHGRMLEIAMWTAVRTLEDRVVLLRRFAEDLRMRGHKLSAERAEAQGAECERRADLIKEAVAALGSPPRSAEATA